VLQEFRNFEIMRENRVLLNKISDISVEGTASVIVQAIFINF